MIRENVFNLKENSLVSEAQKGDLEAFNQLVLLYQNGVFALAFRILGEEDAAEDVTQNAFLSAYRSLSRFRNGSFRSGLYRITANACYDELRRRKRQPSLSLEFAEDAEERLLPLEEMNPSAITPEKAHEQNEIKRAVREAIHRLDANQRVVIELIDLQDLDYQEAAQILGIPLGTLKSRLVRARLRLRDLLKDLAVTYAKEL